LAKTFEYAASLDRDGRLLAEGTPLEPGEAWTPEHLVLAGLMRCTLESLGFHAERAGISVRESAAASEAVVTRREEDGRYAFVEIECGLDVRLDPPPAPEALVELLDLAERDCFVGASLEPAPRYEWRVNGEVAR
jgi:organic hydroperoxide reductase OsmC/OhrA